MSCNGGNVGDGTCRIFPASYDNVISVSSVGHINDVGYIDPTYGANNWKDVHEEIIGDPITAHSHNDKVDICAPGYNVLSTWPNNMYAGNWGTSFATPKVAGVCALMLSANPCLTPDEVESILKSTAVNIYAIPENAPYAGKLGAGRVDAYEAVKEAARRGTNYIQNKVITGTATWFGIYGVSAGRSVIGTTPQGDVVITDGADVTFQGKEAVILEDGFEVQLGGKFEIMTDQDFGCGGGGTGN